MHLQGKKYLIVGVANDHSIAWAIVKKLHELGAELAFTYPNEAIERRVRPLAATVNSELVLPCDVQSDEAITNLFAELGERWGGLDGVLHAAAFADKKDLDCRFSDISRAGFGLALDVSAYSLIALCGKARELLVKNQGSVLTLTYVGAVRVIPNYSLMGVAKAALECTVRYLASDLGPEGVRVNAISAGPVKTLAASAIPQFKELLARFCEKAPLRRNVSTDEIAEAAVFLMSNKGAGVTGEIMYVDCGYNTLGL